MRLIPRQLSRYALAALVALASAAPAGARGSDAGAASTADPPAISIYNFGQVDEHYYRGGQPEGADYSALAAQGIRTVIDLQADGGNADEVELVTAAGMNFVRIGMTGHGAPTSEQIAAFLSIVNDPSLQPVYVHCKVGKHRTGVMTAIYRMERYGWTSDEAFDEMKHYRFGWAFLHPEFKQFVYGYQPGTQPSMTLTREPAVRG